MIAEQPSLVMEARRMAGDLAALAKPCGDSFVGEVLNPLVLVYGLGVQARSPAFWAVYNKALSDLPRSALEQAVQDYASQPGAEFFPRPGPLREMALKAGEKLMRMASRAREAANTEPKRQIPITPLSDVIGAEQPQTRAWPPQHTQSDRELVARMAAEAREKLTRPKDEAKAFQPTKVETNEAGVSLAMLALREQQERRA